MERNFETLKNLSKTQIASIKRVFASSKQFYNKKAKLEAKMTKLQEELVELDRTIATWDYPIIEMTGFTAKEVMDYLENPMEMEEGPTNEPNEYTSTDIQFDSEGPTKEEFQY